MNGNVSVFDPVQADGANVTKGQLHVRSRPMPSGSVAFGQVTVGNSGAEELGAAAERCGFTVRNTHSSETLYIGIGETDPTTSTGFPVPPGATWSLPCGVTTNERIAAIASDTMIAAYMDYLAE